VIPIALLSLLVFFVIASWAYHDAILCTGSTRLALSELVIIALGALCASVPFILYAFGAI
jgi:hypothetical protein